MTQPPPARPDHVTLQHHRCHSAGVELHFGLVRVESGDTADELAHRRAAISGVAAFLLLWAAELDQVSAPGAPELAVFWRGKAAEAAAVDPDSLSGRRRSLSQFYGWDPAAPLPADLMNGLPWGFVYALLAPPLGVDPRRVGYADEGELLTAVVREVLLSPTEATPVWEWDGNWCSYFDSGNQWWGATAWTMAVRADAILVIGASTTD